jgi:anti-anti-sigma factor
MEKVFNAPNRIDGLNSAALQKEMVGDVEAAIAEGADKFVVDMSETTYLSSAGLRVLTLCYKKAKPAGVEFVLRSVSDSVQDLLDVTGLSGYLPME